MYYHTEEKNIILVYFSVLCITIAACRYYKRRDWICLYIRKHKVLSFIAIPTIFLVMFFCYFIILHNKTNANLSYFYMLRYSRFCCFFLMCYSATVVLYLHMRLKCSLVTLIYNNCLHLSCTAVLV